jgi:hypothetical protein
MHLLIPSIINYVPQRLVTKNIKIEIIIGTAEYNKNIETESVNSRTDQ